jgi:hypothetical protein
MAKEKLTGWFRPNQAPVRSGYYDTRSWSWSGELNGEVRLYWNAERRVWRASPNSKSQRLFNQHRAWRGLAHPPKGA